MTTQEQKQEGYITLKEASERFGYTPDYIGQLIRRGRIEGKQVYANVAWMTTSASIEEYLLREKGTEKSKPEKAALLDRTAKLMVSENVNSALVWSFRLLAVFLVIACMFVFYFLSIAIDHRLAQNAEQRLEAKMAVPVPSEPLSESDHVTYGK